MKINNIFYILLCILFVACNKKIKVKESEIIESDKIEIVKLSNLNGDKPIDIMPYLDSLKFVKLELTEESLIGYIQKTIVYKERIYVLDTQTSSLFVFDINGNYIFKIANIGQGPTEYIQLDFFDFDYINEQIVLTDLMGSWVLRYDLDGDFIKRIKIPFWIEGIVPMYDKGYVVFANFRNNKSTMTQEYNLIYLDSLMGVKKAYFPYDSQIIKENKINFSTPQASVFYPYDNSTYFFTTHSYYSYKLNRYGLSPSSKIEFSDKTITYNNIIDDVLRNKENLKNMEIYSIKSFQETDNLICFTFSQPSSPLLYQVFYSKKTNRILYSFLYTIGKEAQFDIPAIASYNSWLISDISTENLFIWKDNMENVNFKNKYLQMKKSLVEELTIEDNPVLMFYKLKEF